MNMEIYNYSLILFALFASGTLRYAVAWGVGENLSFPKGFLIGASSSAYQVEGAWNVDGKVESVWDRYAHSQPQRIDDGSNGDVACDSYHKFKEDIQLVKQMGMKTYRFSLSWTRILPTANPNVINEAGIKYYNDVLDELERQGIEPFVTIYHWDHPQIYQDLGGWTNEEMVELYANYARVIFREFGNRVKNFITINEPHILCYLGYFVGALAPGLTAGKRAEYLCSHNVLKGHARAYHIYNNEFRQRQNGQVGITLDANYYYSKNPNDRTSGNLALQYVFGRFAHPIFSKNGDYPEILKQRVAENSRYEGLRSSRLPTFSKDWIDYLRGSADFMGLNHYSSQLVAPLPRSNDTIYQNDDGLEYTNDPRFPTSANGWSIIPQGFYDTLRFIRDQYGNPPVYVTENGVADDGSLEDNLRIEYLYSYMKAMLGAINNGCNVKGYMVWSLLDSFEWASGYTVKFGMVNVDFNSPNRTRTPKKSVWWMKRIIQEGKLPYART